MADFTPPPLSSWEGPADAPPPAAPQASASSGASGNSGSDWWSANAPPAKAAKPSTESRAKDAKKPIAKPDWSKTQGGPILPAEGILFAAAAEGLSKIDKMFGLTGKTGDKPSKKNGIPANTPIAGAPVTPKPSEVPRVKEATAATAKPVGTVTPQWEPTPPPTPEAPPTWEPGTPAPTVKKAKTTRPPLAVTDTALSQLLKVEAPGPKREALIAEANKRGIAVPELPTRGQEVSEALGETARVDRQFDEAEKRLAAKKQSQNPPRARKTAKPPFIPETGVPEQVARTQDARERIIGKPKEQWTNSDILAADKLIAEGYTGAGGSAEPARKKAEPAAAPEKAPEKTPEEIDAERLKIIGKPKFQWTKGDIEAADQLRAEGQIGDTRPGPKEYTPPKPAPVQPKKEGPLLENQTPVAPEKAPEEKAPIVETPPTPAIESPAADAAKPSATSEEDSPAPPAFKAGVVWGKKGTAKTARGYKVPFRYAVVDESDLITSHDPDTLQENPKFDQGIQPRDRTRAGYEDQINTMVGTLDPEELGHSYKASDGAPFAGDDAMVESGNGRTIAIKRVYKSHPEKASEYSGWVKDSAGDFEIDPEKLKGIPKPVLVRIRTSLPEGVTREDFAQHANEDAKANMGAVETANNDQKAMTPDVMALFEPSENGDINTAGNRQFIQKFSSSVVGPGQKNPFMLADGSVSSEGVRRIRNAVFSKAYGGSTALEKLAEDPSDNTKSITNGLVIAAPKFANMQSAIEKGDLYDLNPSQAIGRAVARLTALRDQKMSIEDFLKQEDIFGKDPVEGVILDIFDKNKRSAKRIASVFKHYVDAVEAIGSPKQQGFFAQDPPTIFEVLEAANDRVKEESKAVKDVPEEIAPPLLAEPASSSGKN